MWQWKLDSALPSRLGQLGDWLYRAEEIVDAEINYAEKPEDTAKHIQSRVDEHKVRKRPSTSRVVSTSTR